MALRNVISTTTMLAECIIDPPRSVPSSLNVSFTPLFPEHGQVSRAGVMIQSSENQTVPSATGLQAKIHFLAYQDLKAFVTRVEKSFSGNVAGTS